MLTQLRPMLRRHFTIKENLILGYLYCNSCGGDAFARGIATGGKDQRDLVLRCRLSCHNFHNNCHEFFVKKRLRFNILTTGKFVCGLERFRRLTPTRIFVCPIGFWTYVASIALQLMHDDSETPRGSFIWNQMTFHSSSILLRSYRCWWHQSL